MTLSGRARACPPLRFPSSHLLLQQLSCKSREQGTGAKKETAKLGTERQPMPIANSTVNHTPAHSQITHPSTHTHTASKTGTGLDGWSGCSTARRYHNSQYLACTHTVRPRPGPRTCCTYLLVGARGTEHSGFLPRKASKASRVRMCAVCVCTGTQSVASLTLTLPICRQTYIHTYTPHPSGASRLAVFLVRGLAAPETSPRWLALIVRLSLSGDSGQ